MPKNEDGEFELVVGNKQLLSIVFILMVLFGVVFSMGYFLGRANSGDGTPVASAPAAPAGQRPDAAGAQTAAAPPVPDHSLQPGEATVSTPDAGTGTAPAGSTMPVSNETPAPEAAPPPAPPRQEPKPVVPPVKQAEPSQAAPSGDAPAPGQTFLQVAAVKRPQAEVLVEALRKKGFHAIMSPVTVEGQEMFRTLVGPVKNASDLAKTKADLESAGLKPIVKKY
jgi:cell division septation protein DedD